MRACPYVNTTNYTIYSREYIIHVHTYVAFTFSPLFIRSLFSTHYRCLLLFGHHIYLYTLLTPTLKMSNRIILVRLGTFFSSEKFYCNNKDYIAALACVRIVTYMWAASRLPITSNSSDCNPISVVAPRIMHPTERSHIKDLHAVTQQQDDPETCFGKIRIFCFYVVGNFWEQIKHYIGF